MAPPIYGCQPSGANAVVAGGTSCGFSVDANNQRAVEIRSKWSIGRQQRDSTRRAHSQAMDSPPSTTSICPVI